MTPLPVPFLPRVGSNVLRCGISWLLFCGLLGAFTNVPQRLKARPPAPNTLPAPATAA